MAQKRDICSCQCPKPDQKRYSCHHRWNIGSKWTGPCHSPAYGSLIGETVIDIQENLHSCSWGWQSRSSIVTLVSRNQNQIYGPEDNTNVIIYSRVMRTVETHIRWLGTKVTISRPEVVQVGDTVTINDLIIGSTTFDAAGNTSLYNVNFLLLSWLNGRRFFLQDCALLKTRIHAFQGWMHQHCIWDSSRWFGDRFPKGVY